MIDLIAMKKRVTVDGESTEIDISGTEVIEIGTGNFLVRKDSRIVEIFATPNGQLSDGHSLDGVVVEVESERERIVRERFSSSLSEKGGAARIASHVVKAPMPGLVKSIGVAVGDLTDKQTTLLVLEAMKMENNILAGVKGRITKVHVLAGNSVEKNAKLVEIEIL
jgi:biotin carboxyl carrier protein